VTTRQFWAAAGGVIIIVAILGVVARNQAKVYRAGRPGNAAADERRAYFEMLQPVALKNCELERFGEPDDGGYLMCGNLLGGVESGYSYGISGYDGWGCDISIKSRITVHQYDCFDPTVPECPKGTTKFHVECVGDKPETVEGRVFDTVWNQFAKNGDRSKRIVLKMDVEGAEWAALLSAPDEVFEHIDQLVIEFHGVGDLRNGTQEQKRRVVQRLKQFFEIGHIHFNNATCTNDLEPFPSWAYEVLFVSKRLASVDPSRRAVGLHPLDAPNLPDEPDCQPKAPSF
jgi:Methyltransferase FkbM domain